MMFWARRRASTNLLGILLFLLASGALLLVIAFILLLSVDRSALRADALLSSLQLQPFLYLAPLVATVLVVRLYDRMPPAWVGLALHRHVWREWGLGIGLGLVMTGLVWLPTALTGTVSTNPALTMNGLLIWGTVLLANAAGEEIVFRGYLFQRITETAGPVAATILVSGGFAAAHLGNPGISPIAVLNVFLAGVLFSAAYFSTGSLWLPIALHATWNMSLALLFGVPMSGIVTGRSLLQTISDGPDLLTGGPFGPEGSVATTAVLVVAGVLLPRLPWAQFSPYVFSRIFRGVYNRRQEEAKGKKTGTTLPPTGHYGS